ncbi:conserved hypothetical protein [Denitrovibrio acetiphilus DSM 12809]|uniref:3-deoxy-D-manno-octulosonic-acid transferase n=1 Tax=Denitrovibrio acetiphilus (strain DSM 12809 / NBRC 114555 / N2460) TaxID=522772 RepID=D4H4I9_DENA2|nr:DUF3800 domain-containing protein [Denitrovibrio acetiphilus]ADD69318.1 conserved hypothetical protein [Denitrovibrio acetiphilus DSM 12809]
MKNIFSDYIVFVDESGDHSLTNTNPSYPIFVLAFCIFKKSDYSDKLIPLMKNFKFKHFGHDQVILHESDIRKDRGAFTFLKSRELKNIFLNEITEIIAETPFKIITTVIKKDELCKKNPEAENPYHIALGFCLERLFYYLRSQDELKSITHVIVENRGKKEDNELELEFRRICDGKNYMGKALPFEIVFADKKSNSTGLQLADLVARPVGLKILKPEQDNRAYNVVKEKFYTNNSGEENGWGLKCHP